jgi:exodeoxyribonuclease V
MANTDFEFNEQQKAAIAKAVQWFKDRKDRKPGVEQVFFLAGYAGTGKTSVAQTIAELCVQAHRVVYIAPTGKAASRLKQKGCRGARTLHSFVYNVRGEDEDGDPIFVGKGALDDKPLLVVCDEASMLGDYDNRVLLDHGIPVLALGDIGQVPPVKAKAVYVEGREDVLLTDIMRQNADSNIVRASMFVRNGKRLPCREYDDVRVREGAPSIADLTDHSGEDGQVICSLNNTRVKLNKMMREALGFSGPIPQIGEKVMCVYNQHSHGFMNGEQGIVLGYEESCGDDPDDPDDVEMRVRLKSLTDGRERVVEFNPLSFSDDPEVKKEAQKNIGGFEYGYAITIHKSQGSEWPKVLVIEEWMRTDYAKLMYTAITRAQSRLTVYRA